MVRAWENCVRNGVGEAKANLWISLWSRQWRNGERNGESTGKPDGRSWLSAPAMPGCCRRSAPRFNARFAAPEGNRFWSCNRWRSCPGRHTEHGERFALACRFDARCRRLQPGSDNHDDQENGPHAGQPKTQAFAVSRCPIGEWGGPGCRHAIVTIAASRRRRKPAAPSSCQVPSRSSAKAFRCQPFGIVDRREIPQSRIAQNGDDNLPRPHRLRQPHRAGDVDPR